jgi:hypothetical protein
VNERLIERLAAIAANLESLTKLEVNPLSLSYEAYISIPNGNTWLLAPAKLKRVERESEIANIAGTTVNAELAIVNDESFNRFVEGKANPQVEALKGHWQFKGSDEDIMVLTQCFFAYGEDRKSVV